ncbi:MAG: hypothetical protein AAFN77_16105 [Planctomycetota bacterium]
MSQDSSQHESLDDKASRSSVLPTVDVARLPYRQLSSTLNDEQRWTIRLLGHMHQGKVDLRQSLLDLGEESSWVRRDCRNAIMQIDQGLTALDALAHSPKLIPRSTLVCLQQLQRQGQMDEFYRCWLQQCETDPLPTFQRQAREPSGSLLGLLIKSALVIWLSTFLLLYIVPQFKSIGDEIGVRPNQAFLLYCEYASLFASRIMPWLSLAAGLYIFYKLFFTPWYRRWMPTRWKLPVETSTVLRRLDTAWLISLFGTSTEDPIDEVSPVPNRIQNSSLFVFLPQRIRAAIEHMTQGRDTIDSLKQAGMLNRGEAQVLRHSGSLSTQTWLLTENVNRRRHRKQSFKGFFRSSLFLIVNLAIGIAVIGACLAIMGFLVQIMENV